MRIWTIMVVVRIPFIEHVWIFNLEPWDLLGLGQAAAWLDLAWLKPQNLLAWFGLGLNLA